MNKIGIIIAREFNERVRKKSFIITTLLMPLLMILMMAAPTIMLLFAKGEQKELLVIDESGKIAPQLKGNDELVFTLTEPSDVRSTICPSTEMPLLSLTVDVFSS